MVGDLERRVTGWRPGETKPDANRPAPAMIVVEADAARPRGMSRAATSEEKLAEQAISRIKPTVVEVLNVGTGLGSGVTMTRDGYKEG